MQEVNKRHYICNCSFNCSDINTINGHIVLQHKYENYRSKFFEQVTRYNITCTGCNCPCYIAHDENLLNTFKEKHPFCVKKDSARPRITNSNYKFLRPIKGKCDSALEEEGCFLPEDLDSMIRHLSHHVPAW